MFQSKLSPQQEITLKTDIESMINNNNGVVDLQALSDKYHFSKASVLKRRYEYFGRPIRNNKKLNKNLDNALPHKTSSLTPVEVMNLEKDIAKRIKDKTISISEGLKVLAEIRKIKELDKVDEKKGYERRIIVIDSGVLECKPEVNEIKKWGSDVNKNPEPIEGDCKQK